MVKGKTAIVLGATGLVGRALVNQLLSDNAIWEVKVFVRRSTEINHRKLSEFFIDFDEPENWKNLIFGDVLFSAFGTTLQTAGSKENQYKIDYTYQYQMAKAAAENGVKDYVLVSAAGASEKSNFFYPRMKGQLDRDVQNLGFASVSILKPSVLAGNRKEPRAGEKAAIVLGNIFKFIPLIRNYRPVDVDIVAKAMINAFKVPHKKELQVYPPGEIFKIAAQLK